MKVVNQLLKNWKTTSAGLILIGGSVIHLIFSIVNKTADEAIYTVTFSAIVGGIGLMFAGDSSASATASTRNAMAIDQINALGANPSAPTATDFISAPGPTVKPNPTTAAEAVAGIKK